jgi:primosomal protein N' (replication factor Y)
MDKCARCSGELRPLGAGTQKIEEEVSALFPGAKVARLDSDTAQNKTYETKTIKAFADGEIDILVGTQMVTKGFDFGNLSLVAVIAADAFLGMQDFRADEKAVQIIGQFRGRTGRRGRKGLMVIQTSQPEHPVYQRIISGDAPEFHRDMLVERKDFGFPPYMRMIEISVRGYREEKVIRVSSDMAAALSGVADVIGPYSPAVDKVADQFVRIVRISLRKDRNLYERKDKIRKIVNDMERVVGRDCVITVNVDPS